VGNLNEELDKGELYPDGAMLTNLDTRLATVADGTFITWETSSSGRTILIPRKDCQGEYIEIQGSPDWVLEVVSNWSVEKDTVELPVTYHRAGIGEYWLVDARGAEIDFQILVRRRTRYAQGPVKAGWHYSPLFDRWFRLVRSANRQGRWRYKLEAKKS